MRRYCTTVLPYAVRTYVRAFVRTYVRTYVHTGYRASSDLSTHDQGLMREEVKALSEIDHPHIVKLYDYVEDNA